MIPRVSQQGVSFNGAGLYYLHDKQAMTAERVGYTETLNLPTNDPEKAMKVMAWVAQHQRDIRESYVASQAQKDGVSYADYVREHNPFRGRQMEKTVYAYSLSWHPSEEISPKQMANAAKETLEVLGLQKHQAVLVQHTDEPHPHMHVIVNKVNPETGLGPKRLNEKTGKQEDALKNDHIRLSIWAERYERETGRILCWNRVENNARRFPADGSPSEYVKYKVEHASRADYDWWKGNEHRPADQIRSQRLQDQAAGRTELQMREAKARERFKGKLERDYAAPVKTLNDQIRSAENRLEADRTKPLLKDGVIPYARGMIRRSVRLLMKSGQRDRQIIKDLKKGVESLEKEKAAREKRFDRSIAKKWLKLKSRQVTERERDEQRISLRDKERSLQKTKTKAPEKQQTEPAKSTQKTITPLPHLESAIVTAIDKEPARGNVIHRKETMIMNFLVICNVTRYIVI